MFFVLGTQKAGTTSLHSWLKQQPEVCLPAHKETNFFAYSELFGKGLEWYERQFHCADNQDVRGEISPNYMFFEKAAARIHGAFPDARLVFIFRHPIERAYSHYLMMKRSGYETKSFGDALALEERRIASGEESDFINFSYMARGNYARQVRRFMDCFPRESMLFVKYDDLVASGRQGSAAYERICGFVGVRSSCTLANRDVVLNAASTPRCVWLRDLLYGRGLVKKLARTIVPSKAARIVIGEMVDSWNQRKLAVEGEISVPGFALEWAEHEIIELERTTGLDLSSWFSRRYGACRG